MKNILIIGCARAGKTTLAKMIKEKYPTMNLMLMDSIKNAVLRNMKNYDKNNIEENMKFEHSDFNIGMLLECFESHIRNDKTNKGYIFEGSQLIPGKFYKDVDKYEMLVVCLGLGDISSIELFSNIRKFDTPDDWTYTIPDEELKLLCKYWVELDNFLIKECAIYNIKYFNTTGDRKIKLESALDYLESNF